MTVDEIYARMAAAYAEKAGFMPEDAADPGTSGTVTYIVNPQDL